MPYVLRSGGWKKRSARDDTGSTFTTRRDVPFVRGPGTIASVQHETCRTSTGRIPLALVRILHAKDPNRIVDPGTHTQGTTIAQGEEIVEMFHTVVGSAGVEATHQNARRIETKPSNDVHVPKGTATTFRRGRRDLSTRGLVPRKGTVYRFLVDREPFVRRKRRLPRGCGVRIHETVTHVNGNDPGSNRT